MLYGGCPRFDPQEVHVARLATDYAVLTRICEFARRLHQLHRLGNDDAIDREFSAVCRAIWGFTLDDFTDDDLSAEDHAWLDQLTQECAINFAAGQGYDLKDYVHGGSEPPRGADTVRRRGGRSRHRRRNLSSNAAVQVHFRLRRAHTDTRTAQRGG
jgi:hypothetical protein